LDDDIASLRTQMRLPVSINAVSSGKYVVAVAHCLALTNSPTARASPLRHVSPASSDLNDELQPPSKKRRVSTSSLSEEDDEEDEEENKPLAERVASTHAVKRTTRLAPGHQSGEKKSKGHTAPTSHLPPIGQDKVEMNSKPGGMNDYEPKVEIEDKVDENQLTHLATGVTVDAGGPVPQVV
jgi:histone acetyltransferase